MNLFLIFLQIGSLFANENISHFLG